MRNESIGATRVPAMRFWLASILLIICLPGTSTPSADTLSLMPEQRRIHEIAAGDKPEGILFLVMEHDSEALEWVLPRILYYTKRLKSRWRDLSVNILSHGDEMLALQEEYRALYPRVHRIARELVERHDVLFMVCGAFASMEDIPPSAFPDFITVVPFGPAEIENYRNLEYTLVHIEQTW